MDYPIVKLVMIPEDEWNGFKLLQGEILEKLKGVSAGKTVAPGSSYLTPKEFMAEVKIKRTKFNQLVQTSKIKIIKKKRKIYVPVGEVGRYFSDAGIR